jgi:rSAM/selenodomain-associated transferase 2
MKISVIIPVLNEEDTIRTTLSSLHISSKEEIVVIDGGSDDGTVSIAQEFTQQVYVTERGRGHQLKNGAGKATGDILLFLHADCILPNNSFSLIRDVMSNDEYSIGAFYLGIDHPSFCFRVIEFGANLRSWITRVPYGDQGLFMRRDDYEKIGGFCDIPLMEDVDLSKRMKKIGRVKFVKDAIMASPRRWLKEGLLYTTVRDWKLSLSYALLNAKPKELLKEYEDVR